MGTVNCSRITSSGFDSWKKSYILGFSLMNIEVALVLSCRCQLAQLFVFFSVFCHLCLQSWAFFWIIPKHVSAATFPPAVWQHFPSGTSFLCIQFSVVPNQEYKKLPHRHFLKAAAFRLMNRRAVHCINAALRNITHKHTHIQSGLNISIKALFTLSKTAAAYYFLKHRMEQPVLGSVTWTWLRSPRQSWVRHRSVRLSLSKTGNVVTLQHL